MQDTSLAADADTLNPSCQLGSEAPIGLQNATSPTEAESQRLLRAETASLLDAEPDGTRQVVTSQPGADECSTATTHCPAVSADSTAEPDTADAHKPDQAVHLLPHNTLDDSYQVAERPGSRQPELTEPLQHPSGSADGDLEQLQSQLR